MPLAPEICKLLDAVAALGTPPVNEQTPAVARAAYRQLTALAPHSTATLATVHDTTCEGSGGALGLRIYTPEGRAPFPALVYFHGGGFVIGDLDTHDNACRELCAGARCVVVSVDYRLAPEHKFPSAVEDCLAATRWVMAQRATLHITDRVAVGGDSAGANLATVVARHLRDTGESMPCAQLLAYPVTDHYSRETASLRDNANGYLLTRDSMVWFADHYLRGPADIDNPDSAPLRAVSLHGLPPAWVATCEFDPLRDEGEAYARRLQAEGVPTTAKRYDGAIHGIFKSPTSLKLGRQMMDDACAWLKRCFEA
ncbi:MAG TPA: alpha/beta hydrolase [Rhodanobacteraceae bacterium]|nr:alpha/beta hydrolase [Rhodanobacteraceae bacterium]